MPQGAGAGSVRRGWERGLTHPFLGLSLLRAWLLRAFLLSHCRSRLQFRTWPLITALSSPTCPTLPQQEPLSSPSFLATAPLEALPLVQNPSTRGSGPSWRVFPPGSSLSVPQHLQGACCGQELRELQSPQRGGQGPCLRSPHSEHTSQSDLREVVGSPVFPLV